MDQTAVRRLLKPSHLLGLLPVPGYVALIVLLSAELTAERAASLVFDPPALMLVLNTLLLFGVSVVAFAIATRAYLASGASSILLLGCGVLSLGGAALVGGWIRPLGGTPNASVTSHNLGVLAAAILHAASALLTLIRVKPEPSFQRRRAKLLAGMIGAVAAIAVTGWASVSSLVPPFWVAGQGSTAIKTAVLAISVSLFALASLYTMILYVRGYPGFLFWYSLALALTATGLVGITVMKAVGDPIGWAGRTAQYLGGLYFLGAVLRALAEARTEGMSLETALSRYYRQSDLHFRDLVETAIDAILSIDDRHRVLLWNHGAERMLGYSREEAAGRRVSDLILPAGQGEALDSELEDLQRRAGRSASSKEIELQLQRKDLSVFPSLVCISMRRQESKWTATLVAHDISAQKRMEVTLREWNETLETRVAERTAVAEERAQQLKALAVQLMEAEERERKRIADLLHDDLQQLLTGARLKTQALASACAKDPAARALSERVAEHLLEAIAKSRRLSHELSPAILQHRELSAVLEWLAGRMREQYGLEVMVKLTEDWSEQAAEPYKVFFYSAAQELLLNVAKHGRAGRATIDLTGRQRRLQMAVSDDGCGFEPLLTGAAGDAGLGLIRLRERAGYLGGELTVESAPGHGSRITVAVPWKDSEDFAARKEQEATRKQPQPAMAGRSLPAAPAVHRVLIADDHNLVRQGLVTALQGSRGIEVVGQAATGREALNLALELKPDVVLMDAAMPEMDGIEATRRIKKATPKVRVIGLSMHEEDEMAAAMRQAGAEAYLSKAGSIEQLVQAICRPQESGASHQG
jgi:PAS domain S-box-containing protein